MKQIFLSLFIAAGLLFTYSAANAQDDIWEHTPSPYKVFKSGGSIFVPLEVMDREDLIGRDCGQYVIPHDAADDMLDWARTKNQDGSTCYDIQSIERAMGINDGAWDNKTLVRVNMRTEALHELRLHWPSENDCVPYEQWMDGISGCCGVPIAIVSPVPPEYVVIVDKEIKPCKKTKPGIPVPWWLPTPCDIPRCCDCIPLAPY
ncbi:MAG: hypothetical protein BGO69_09910 [Bacteroidetes bacterium 46-16]|nr:MAG: hypothetical protein BGO69_09910 [Bacteroidetes bacterium 46-16]